MQISILMLSLEAYSKLPQSVELSLRHTNTGWYIKASKRGNITPTKVYGNPNGRIQLTPVGAKFHNIDNKGIEPIDIIEEEIPADRVRVLKDRNIFIPYV